LGPTGALPPSLGTKEALMQIIDIVTFNNQIELLDLRISILQDVVDVFYIIESTKTHQGNPKEVLGDRYSHPKLKVITIDFPEHLDTWGRERYQRNHHISLDSYDHDSMVITSDLDEVPNPQAVLWLKDHFKLDTVYGLEQQLYQYYLNVENTTEHWIGTKICGVDLYNSIGAEDLRMDRHQSHQTTLQDAGWHWSYLGGEEAVQQKIKDYAHSEFNNEEVLSQIKTRLENNEDVLGRRQVILKTVPIDESYPDYILNNQEQLAHFIKEL